MEGLIPFVMQAIKNMQERSTYQGLPEGSAGEGSAHLRRTASEFQARRDLYSPDHKQELRRRASSRGVREGPLPPIVA